MKPGYAKLTKIDSIKALDDALAFILTNLADISIS